MSGYDPEEMSEVLVSLREATSELNMGGDKAQKVIRTTEEILSKFGIGVRLFLPTPFYKDWRLGYGKTEAGGWNLLAQRHKDGYPVDSAVILKEAPRLHRIRAARQIPDLHRALLVAVKDELAEANSDR